MRAMVAFAWLALLGGLSGCTCSNTWTDRCETRDDCPGDQICLDGHCVPPHVDDGGPDGGDASDEPDDRDVGPADGDADGDGDWPDCFDCVTAASGVGTDNPFDLEDPETPNEGVALDRDGAIVLDHRVIDTGFIWIANTGAGQVVKVDTDTFEEVGRYATGSDPSRTSVNSAGDVYVGNRAGRSVTKISVLGAACPDTNGDGVVTTSAGGGDVLPFGEDDCVLWRTELPDGGIIRAVAAQDELGPDGELQPYVWIGGWDGVIWKLDGNDGSIVLRTTSPLPPYGFALDGAGNLWIASTSSNLGRLDTLRCRDEASCDVEVCIGETAECDGAVKQRIPMPSSGYGITVDFLQRVWIAGGTLKRYDFSAPAGARWAEARPGYGCHGIGADAVGFVYAACQGASTVVRVDGDDPSRFVILPTQANRGIGIDADGKIWGINRSASVAAANVITPGPTLEDNAILVGVGPVLSSPYTYSDMTGLQLRLATNPRGSYRTVVEGCAPPTETEWGPLSWEAETPSGTRIIVRIRTAETRGALETVPWLVVATVPPDGPPVEVGDALDAAGVPPGRYLMIELILEAERTSLTEVISPRVLSLEQRLVCPTLVD